MIDTCNPELCFISLAQKLRREEVKGDVGYCSELSFCFTDAALFVRGYRGDKPFGNIAGEVDRDGGPPIGISDYMREPPGSVAHRSLCYLTLALQRSQFEIRFFQDIGISVTLELIGIKGCKI